MSKSDIKYGKKFCPLPWISTYVSPTGKVFPCCVGHNIYENIHNVTEDTRLDDFINNDVYKDIRLKMMNGEEHNFCTDCYKKEDGGLKSDRLSHLNDWIDTQEIDDVLEKTAEDGSVDDFKLLYIDHRDSNLCNYKCRMCDLHSSSTWLKDRTAMQGDRSNIIEKLGVNPKTGISESGFNWQREDLSHVQKLHFAGGEPLFMPETYETLQKYIDIGRAKDVEVGIISNMSKLEYGNKNILSLLSHFKAVYISCSIDAMGNAHGYLRSAKDDWNIVEKNLDTMIKWRVKMMENPPHKDFFCRIQFHSTITWMSSLQWYDLYRRYHLLPENDLERCQFRVHFLSDPKGMGVCSLPDKELDQIIKYYQGKPNTAEIREIINYCNNMKNNKTISARDQEFKRFKTYNWKLDKLRETKFKDAFPEWEEFYINHMSIDDFDEAWQEYLDVPSWKRGIVDE